MIKPYERWKRRLSVYTGTHITVLMFSKMLNPHGPRDRGETRVVADQVEEWEAEGYSSFYIIRTICRECFRMSILITPEKDTTEEDLFSVPCHFCEGEKTAECIGDEIPFQQAGL